MSKKGLISHICLISDDNYVMPTCVALQSLIDSKKEGVYYIHIIASSLSAATEKKFKKFESEDIVVDVIRENAEKRFEGFHAFDRNAICVASISALLKFLIPELFPDIDKILYLDGDLIVKTDVSELFVDDLEDYYAAAVIDSGSMYYKHQYVKKVQHYFNSGVMLLNLKKMRDENITEKLVNTKKNLDDVSLMDQNVFNLVFDGKIRLLPIRYNFMPVSLERAYSKWTIKQVNELYGTNYENKKQLFADAAIIHYSSKDKPWKALDGACAAEWISYYLKAPIEHDLVVLDTEKKEQYGISVIMPCFNAEEFLIETLDSILKQTFQDIEIICIDDGSTDNTLAILRQYAEKNKNITVIADVNHRQGYQRNQGIRRAKGKYLYYMDSDDLLMPTCFETIYRCAEENRLDLLYFEGTAFYESSALEEKHPEFKRYYNRREAFPKVYSGDELYIKLRNTGGQIVSPCLQLVRKDFIINHFLYFPELPLLEDNLYTFSTILKATRVKCLCDVLFFRRVRDNSTMTEAASIAKSQERIQAYAFIIQEMTKKMIKYEFGSPMHTAIANHIRGQYRLLFETISVLNQSLENTRNGQSWTDILESGQKEYGLAATYINFIETKNLKMASELQELNVKSVQQENEIKHLKEQINSLKFGFGK